MAMRHFNPTFHFIAPPEPCLRRRTSCIARAQRIKFQNTGIPTKRSSPTQTPYMGFKETFSPTSWNMKGSKMYILKMTCCRAQNRTWRYCIRFRLVSAVATMWTTIRIPTISSRLKTVSMRVNHLLLCPGHHDGRCVERQNYSLAKYKQQVKWIRKKRLVAAIENGTVIDHIPAGKTYQVANTRSPRPHHSRDHRKQFRVEEDWKKGIIKVSTNFSQTKRYPDFLSWLQNRAQHHQRLWGDRKENGRDVWWIAGIVKCNNPKMHYKQRTHGDGFSMSWTKSAASWNATIATRNKRWTKLIFVSSPIVHKSQRWAIK